MILTVKKWKKKIKTRENTKNSICWLWAREIVQWVECLSGKHEDLVWVTSTHIIKQNNNKKNKPQNSGMTAQCWEEWRQEDPCQAGKRVGTTGLLKAEAGILDFGFQQKVPKSLSNSYWLYPFLMRCA